MPSRLKEKFLLYRIRAKKDSDAFAEIYDLYIGRIYRFIFFKVPSAEVAEDLTSETFLKAWQYLMGTRDVPHLQALLYSIARNSVIDWYRKSASEQGDISLDEAVANDLAGTGSEQLLMDIDRAFDMSDVAAGLRRLKDEYREVIVMKYLDQMSAKEIATALGKTPSHVRVIAHRAIKALGDALTTESDDPTSDAKPAGKDS
jgi:RNA polymerase sigma-70 factor (ECF subfamily)